MLHQQLLACPGGKEQMLLSQGMDLQVSTMTAADSAPSSAAACSFCLLDCQWLAHFASGLGKCALGAAAATTQQLPLQNQLA